MIKIKYLHLFLSFVTVLSISGCSSSKADDSGVSSTFSNVTEESELLTVSRIGIIPTNFGTAGSHSLLISNLTNKSLKFNNFVLSNSSTSSFLTRVTSALTRGAGGAAYDLQLNALDCSVIQPKSSCVVQFTPPEADGSTAVKLNFTANDGSNYSVAQLVEYSSSVNNAKGFLVSNTNIDSVASMNQYSLSIPFVTTEDYKTIEVVSRVLTISQFSNCEQNVAKKTHCTAILTLPAGPANSYSNTITLIGTKADGSKNSIVLMSGNIYKNIAHLSVSNGPLNIAYKNDDNATLSKSLHVVNDSNVIATGLSDILTAEETALNGGTVTKNLLKKKFVCNGKNVNELPDLAPAEFCEVRFSLYERATVGSSNYKIIYNRGNSLDASLANTIKINFIGSETPDYSITSTGNFNFLNTHVSLGNEIPRINSITILNQGKKAVRQLQLAPLDTNFPNGMTIDANNSTCLDYTENNKDFLPNESCTFSLRYAPQTAVEAKSFIVAVSAKQATVDMLPLTSIKRTVEYSALTQGVGVVVVPANNNLAISADGNNNIERVIAIQNVGAADYTLTAIKATGAPDSSTLKLSVPDKLINGEGNPFRGISLAADGSAKNLAINLQAGAFAELQYNYGPTKQAESGILQQQLVGAFSKPTDGENIPIITRYLASYSTVQPSIDNINITTPEDLNNLDRPFVLTHNNTISITYKYKFTALTKTFRIEDNDLAVNWFTVNGGGFNSCPLSSRGDTPRTFNSGDQCLVTIQYLPQNKLSDAFFYTAATANNQVRTVFAPKYRYQDSNTNISIVSPQLETKFQPKSFAQTNAAVTNIGQDSNKIYDIYQLELSLASYPGQSLLNSAPIKAEMIIPQENQSVFVEGGVNSCIINPQISQPQIATCSLRVLVSVNATLNERNIAIRYSSLDTPGYNTFYKTISF